MSQSEGFGRCWLMASWGVRCAAKGTGAAGSSQDTSSRATRPRSDGSLFRYCSALARASARQRRRPARKERSEVEAEERAFTGIQPPDRNGRRQLSLQHVPRSWRSRRGSTHAPATRERRGPAPVWAAAPALGFPFRLDSGGPPNQSVDSFSRVVHPEDGRSTFELFWAQAYQAPLGRSSQPVDSTGVMSPPPHPPRPSGSHDEYACASHRPCRLPYFVLLATGRRTHAARSSAGTRVGSPALAQSV
jgi:hypothetical protein